MPEFLSLIHISDSQYTELEAKILDLALVLHADHGGGNNSTFTTHVVTSSGTDTYSTIAAALGSLKGPKHGGANIKVVQMFEDMKKTVKNWNDEDEVANYLRYLSGHCPSMGDEFLDSTDRKDGRRMAIHLYG